MNKSPVVVFFDIGATLGNPRISPPPRRLEGLDVYPFVFDILTELQCESRLGIISNTGNETLDSMQRVLAEARLYDFFVPDLLIYSSVVGMEKDSPAIFKLAAQSAGNAECPQNCVFVGEDSREREFALQAGMRVCPHPLLVKDVLRGTPLRFVRLRAPSEPVGTPWRSVLRQLPIVPLHVSGEGGTKIHAIVPMTALSALANAQFDVEPLGDPDDPLRMDLYLIRDDLATETGALSLEGQSARLMTDPQDDRMMLSTSDEGLLVRIPGNRSVEEFHFEQTEHGHNLKLTALPSLLEPFGDGLDERSANFLTAEAADRPLSDSEKMELAKITPDAILNYLDRYSGKKPLGDPLGTAITSRHIHSGDNARVTDMLARDLRSIGGSRFSVSLHSFTHEGRTLYNVQAEMAGAASDEFVLLTAHLDSTAASSRPYDAARDPAPGADDDGSGVAAVLAAAETIVRLAATDQPERGLRFVFFNAEEHGLVGSRAYARDVSAASTPIVAVYQLDMIGYNVAAPRSFEVHAGYTPSADVQGRSMTLGERIQRTTTEVSPALSTPQMYNSTGSRDPAEGRSDHTPFHQMGYAACLISEDFFIGPRSDSPTPEPNPQYHKKTDTFVDPIYSADIARSVTAAAWLTANFSTTSQNGEQTMGIKIGSGSTTPGSTNWKAYGGDTGVYLDVDTSSCSFTTTPKYTTSLGGSSSHWATTGATSIYVPKPNGFRVYVRWANGANLTPAQANNLKWHINWLGVE